ncbi:MAG: hypothetical protein ACHBN1_38500, partial [Heteroscytonema crispum UTEX LB 1556]
STLAHYLMQSFISLLVAKPNLPLLMARFMVHNLAQIMIQVIMAAFEDAVADIEQYMESKQKKVKNLVEFLASFFEF